MKTILDVIEEERKFLPDQAPLEFFVHHNTLHNLEKINFQEAVESTAERYGNKPYMDLAFYREEYRKGNIQNDLIEKEMDAFLKEQEIMKPFLEYLLKDASLSNDLGELRYQAASNFQEVFTLSEIRTWSTARTLSFFPEAFQDKLQKSDELIITFLSAYMDQGISYWRFPENIYKNVLNAFSDFLKSSGISSDQMKSVNEAMKRYAGDPDEQMTALSKEHGEEFIRTLLRRLSGWAGMVAKLEREPHFASRRKPEITLKDYLFMRLILERIYPLQDEADEVLLTDMEFFINFFVTSFKSKESSLNNSLCAEFMGKLSLWELQRILHQAYEKTFIEKILSGLSISETKNETCKPRYQVYFCLDDREESIRRHLEEIDPEVATFGAAGFFGLDMQFQSFKAVRPRKLCPPPVTPSTIVKEESLEKVSTSGSRVLLHYGERTLFRSTILSLLQGPLKFLDLKKKLFIGPQKKPDAPTKIEIPYTLEEKAKRISTILMSSGLVKDFAELVVLFGHGANSINNPHLAAYRCGACAGGNGAPNARIFALIANDPDVRAALKTYYSIDIPETTYFVGGFHDTTSDDLIFSDENLIPPQFKESFEKFKAYCRKASALNAQERLRRLHLCSLDMTPLECKKHAEHRGNHPGETRPELGHATNAISIVGRREFTKNLFLDRRAFLTSYDPSIDPEGKILAAILGAVIPVCAGISLEYYFSKVDNDRYGSGTKTPHNVVGLLGVINGSMGDLRTGLVWQMVEFHEPRRILFIIETTPEIMTKILNENPGNKRLVENQWVYLALKEPTSNQYYVFESGKFQKFVPKKMIFPTGKKSPDLYLGKRDQIDFAVISP